MSITSISIADWVSVGVGLFGLISAALARKGRLPSWARKWLDRVGPERITEAIEKAAAIAELTPEQRRAEAVAFLQRLALRELGFPIPASVANLLVEYVYQQWKRARR